MNPNSDFQPNWASAPGDTIADILGEQSLSVREFARRLGKTAGHANDLLRGRIAITSEIAQRLEEVLGGSEAFWMAREAQYRRDLTRLELQSRSVSRNTWVDELPVAEMINFGWIKPTSSSRSAREAACLGFFGVPDVEAWHDTYRDVLETYSFRTSSSFAELSGAVAAWLRRGELEAASIDCRSWSEARFKEALVIIRRLTWKNNPALFIPKLQKLCADCGVAVAIVRAPTGCRASGATRFLSPSRALLLLSFRYLSDDHFWFTFFHEAGHLLLHGKDVLFLEGFGLVSTSEEEEANRFAAGALIPNEYESKLLELGSEPHDVIRFARRIGVSPGIVVGQLQHRGRLKRNQLNRLKRRFDWGSSD